MTQMRAQKPSQNILRAGPSLTAGAWPPRQPLSAPLGVGIFLLLWLCGIAIYANALHNPFIWDDPYLITDNRLIKDLRHLPDLFRYHLYYSTAGLSNFYRPFQALLVMADYAIWKLNPFGYHLTSLLVHVLCGWCVFLLVDEVVRRRLVAVLVSLLFVAHPANSTVVDYISSRADSQAALCMVLSCWLFLRALSTDDHTQGQGSRRGRFLYIGALGAFICGLLSKEMVVVLPLLMWTSARILGYRSVFKKLIPFVAVLAVYAILRVTVLTFPDPTAMEPPSLWTRLLTSAEALVRLVGILIWPGVIHIEKHLPFSEGLLQPSTMASLAILAVVGWSVWWLGKRSTLYRFGWMWFVIGLLPMMNIVPINTTLADHWLYLPCVGVFLVAIGGVDELIGKMAQPRRAWAARMAVAGYAVLLVAFACRTVQQNTIWASPKVFFQEALKHYPGSFRAHNELGVVYLDAYKPELALAEFQQAVKLNPRFDQAYDNLGVAYDRLGKIQESIEAHLHAMRINPNNPKIYNNLGNAYYQVKQWDQAIQVFEQALKLNPDYAAVYNNLGAVYFQQRQFAKAREAWRKALALDPGFEMVQNNLKMLEEKERQEGQPSSLAAP